MLNGFDPPDKVNNPHSGTFARCAIVPLSFWQQGTRIFIDQFTPLGVQQTRRET